MSILYMYRCVQYIIVIALPWVPRLRPIRSTEVTHAELWREAEVFRHPEACGRPGDATVGTSSWKITSARIHPEKLLEI